MASKTNETIQLREYAARICVVFNGLLEDHEIIIPDDCREGEDDEAALFGDAYYATEDAVTNILSKLVAKIEENPRMEILEDVMPNKADSFVTPSNPFFSLKVGDTVTAFDPYSRDWNIHKVEIESIEYNQENITEENPKGMTCYGRDIEEEEWGDDYLAVVTPENFLQKLKGAIIDV